MTNAPVGRLRAGFLLTILTAALSVLFVLAPARAGAAGTGGGTTLTGLVGYDVSYPQCNRPLPAPGPFTVVGVNGGLAYSTNACLSALHRWAAEGQHPDGPGVMLYANTGNPGPVASPRWPAGQTWPRWCDGTWNEDCAYDYGWNAAGEAFGVAVDALSYDEAAGAAWWLDVETANSWNRTDLDTNVAALEGFVDRLTILAPYHPVGIYSTRYQWGLITGADGPFSLRNTPFADLPNWVAGATAASAPSFCSESFTGGPVHYVQFVQDGIDHDLAC